MKIASTHSIFITCKLISLCQVECYFFTTFNVICEWTFVYLVAKTTRDIISKKIMENFYSSAKPFYYLGKALGLFPMSFVGSEAKGVLQTKWHGVLSSVVSFSLLVILVCLNSMPEKQSTSSSTMLTEIWKIQVVLLLLFICIQFIDQICKRKSIASFLEIVNRIDIKVTDKRKLKLFKE